MVPSAAPVPPILRSPFSEGGWAAAGKEPVTAATAPAAQMTDLKRMNLFRCMFPSASCFAAWQRKEQIKQDGFLRQLHSEKG
jgi:hypothetical protein